MSARCSPVRTIHAEPALEVSRPSRRHETSAGWLLPGHHLDQRPGAHPQPAEEHDSIGPTRYHRAVVDKPERLHFTGDDEADRLLAEEPMALLIGFVLDQQVPLQKAFSGPLELRRRIGTLDASEIANLEPGTLEEAFTRRPALHRFPGNMARRTQALSAFIAERYQGDASRVWQEATDGRDLHRRLLALPGIGEMKAGTLVAILGKRFGVRPAGWEEAMPHHPTLGDVDSAETLANYQAGKRAHKAEMRAQAARESESTA
jgi:uncharacterized HhH-GPD family protein